MKRLIFTVTTGRSGSSLLAYKMSLLKGVVATHEPYPRFNDVWQDCINDENAAEQFLKEEKIPFIENLPGSIYIETSHFFLKGFFFPLVKKIGLIPDLILLNRSANEVAYSMYRLGTIPGISNDYLNISQHRHVSAEQYDELHDFQKCLLYCYEVDSIQSEFKEVILHFGGAVSEISLDELKGSGALKKLRAELNLPGYSIMGYVKTIYRRMFPLVTNRKLEQKANSKLSDDLMFDLENELKRRLIKLQGNS